jgi:4-carboxymuconolactone decarboxylase
MDSDRDRQGVEMYNQVFGRLPGPDRTGLRAMTIRHLFGEVWTRPALEPRLRSLVTLAILASEGRSTELAEHLEGAIHLGWSTDELLETMIHVAHYAGWPAGHTGQKAILRALDPDQRVLRELTQRIADAETKGDKPFFKDLLHPRFVFRRARGTVDSKKTFLAALRPGPNRSVDVESVDVLGKHRATVRTVVTNAAGDNVSEYDNFQVFLREDDGPWRLFCWANEPKS